MKKLVFYLNLEDAKSLCEQIIEAITMDDTSIKLIGKEGRKNIIKNLMLKNVFFYLFRI